MLMIWAIYQQIKRFRVAGEEESVKQYPPDVQTLSLIS